ncbi:uncharacterized protein msb1l [Battus philenor]|uniref:uncharacterized protein msb1l n=1 Tax=Battus philenor TaxID=42288 RepID=UPI0035CF4E51
MGTNTSKPTIETAAPQQKSDLNIGDNPDPRSPTPEITRTPLQNKSTSKHNITKNVDLRKTFESGEPDEKLILNNPILSAVIKNHLQSYDPRSPTQEIERTPIVISTTKDDETTFKKNLRLQNNNTYSPCLKNEFHDSFETTDTINLSPDLVIAKNLCEEFYDMSISETLNENEEQLGSSTTSNNNCIEEASGLEHIDQPKTLLETNFDYVELESEKYEDSEQMILKNKCIEDSELELKKIPVFKILDDDPRSPSMGIERTPIVVAKTEESGSNVEEMSDDTLIKVLQSTNVDQSENMKDNNNGLLIYEDEAVSIDTPRKTKSISMNGARTPLSCMKNKADTAHTRSKSANTYETNKDSTLPVKHLKYVSHIPRLKSLSKPISTGSSVSLKNISKNSAISGDCENTPPHSHRDKWDKDNSIVL